MKRYKNIFGNGFFFIKARIINIENVSNAECGSYILLQRSSYNKINSR